MLVMAGYVGNQASDAAVPGGIGRDKRSILLYSHDTFGLGHLRRNSAIAHAVLRRQPDVRVAMLTGSAVARAHVPAGVRLVQMPSVVKVGREKYKPLVGESMSELRAERVRVICSALLHLRPDVFLVDHSPLGMKGELRLALKLARHALPRTRVVLGLRDILDDPHVVRETWAVQGVYSALESYYDQVLVYGCRDLFDVTEMYALSRSVRLRTIFTGYVAKVRSIEPALPTGLGWGASGDVSTRRVLVMGGGGGDAAEVFGAFLEAWPGIAQNAHTQALMVTGPLMDEPARREIERLAGQMPRLKVIRSSTSMLSLIAGADVVVSMGGYNSVVETLSARRPLVIFPRVEPRQEQLIRARVLEGLGLAQVVPPSPAAPGDLMRAVLKALDSRLPGPDVWRRIDLGGGDKVAHVLLYRVRAHALAG